MSTRQGTHRAKKSPGPEDQQEHIASIDVAEQHKREEQHDPARRRAGAVPGAHPDRIWV